jgi:hypothetical protein
MACQREIVQFVVPAMLPRYDVLNVVNGFAMRLAQQTIFALVRRASPNGIARNGIHCLTGACYQVPPGL